MRAPDWLAGLFAEPPGEPPSAGAGGGIGLSTSHITPFPATNMPHVSRETYQQLNTPEMRARLDRVMARHQALRDSVGRHEARARPDREPRALITEGGAVFTIQVPSDGLPFAGGGPRGLIHELSAASRRRLMRLCASINLQAMGGYPIFITLTYPQEYPTNATDFKAHLQAFLKRFRRVYGRAAGVWRLEPQARQAPHYHLLVYGAAYVDYNWVAQNWYEVVDSGDARHLAAGTRTEAIRSYNGVLSYAAKYISKRPADSKPLAWGRWWGVFNKKGLAVSVSSTALTPQVCNALQRAQRDVLARRGARLRATKRQRSSTIFLPAPQANHLVAGYVRPIVPRRPLAYLILAELRVAHRSQLPQDTTSILVSEND